MDVRFTPEQHALRESVSAVTGRLGPKTVRDLDDGDRAAKLDAAVEASGWRELRCDAGGGSPLASAVEVAIVAEQLGKGLADVAYLGPVMASELRRIAGVDPHATRESLLIGSRAVDAQGCSGALGLDGYQVVQADTGAESRGDDLTRRDAPLTGEPVGVGRIDAGSAGRWTALGLALTCADLVGVMAGATDLACGYARSRQQFGVAIGSFQAIQHLLADAHVATEGSRSVALHAAWAVDSVSPEDSLRASSVAKAYCARSARFVCEAAIQIHGGIGNTWDCLAHVYLRRALLSIELFGGVGPSLERVLDHAGIGDADGFR